VYSIPCHNSELPIVWLSLSQYFPVTFIKLYRQQTLRQLAFRLFLILMKLLAAYFLPVNWAATQHHTAIRSFPRVKWKRELETNKQTKNSWVERKTKTEKENGNKNAITIYICICSAITHHPPTNAQLTIWFNIGLLTNALPTIHFSISKATPAKSKATTTSWPTPHSLMAFCMMSDGMENLLA